MGSRGSDPIQQNRMDIIHTYNFNITCPLGNLNNDFMATRALVRRVYVTCTYVMYPMNCHEAITVIAKKHVLRLHVFVYICALKTAIENFILLHFF